MVTNTSLVTLLATDGDGASHTVVLFYFQMAGQGIEAIEHLYSVEQVPIPPELPEILKQYSKAVIRAQPNDVLGFSVLYFGKLASSNSKLVLDESKLHDLVKFLARGPAELPVAKLYEIWGNRGLDKELLQSILRYGNVLEPFHVCCVILDGEVRVALLYA